MALDIVDHMRQSSERYRRDEAIQRVPRSIQLIDAETAERLRKRERKMQLLSTIICVYRGKFASNEERTTMDDWNYSTTQPYNRWGGNIAEIFSFRGLETKLFECIEETKGIFHRRIVIKGYYFPEWDISISAGAMSSIKEYYSTVWA